MCSLRHARGMQHDFVLTDQMHNLEAGPSTLLALHKGCKLLFCSKEFDEMEKARREAEQKRRERE